MFSYIGDCSLAPSTMFSCVGGCSLTPSTMFSCAGEIVFMFLQMEYGTAVECGTIYIDHCWYAALERLYQGALLAVQTHRGAPWPQTSDLSIQKMGVCPLFIFADHFSNCGFVLTRRWYSLHYVRHLGTRSAIASYVYVRMRLCVDDDNPYVRTLRHLHTRGSLRSWVKWQRCAAENDTISELLIFSCNFFKKS